jgi:hypothetical protein
MSGGPGGGPELRIDGDDGPFSKEVRLRKQECPSTPNAPTRGVFIHNFQSTQDFVGVQ